MNTKKINRSRTRLYFLLFLGLLGECGLTALPVAAAPFAYVTNFDGNSISVITTAINIVAYTITHDTLPTAVAVGLTPHGICAYVMGNNSGMVKEGVL